jgi:hypothetical protein
MGPKRPFSQSACSTASSVGWTYDVTGVWLSSLEWNR